MLKENILKKAPHLGIKTTHRLPNISWRILHSKRRSLLFPMPDEHPDKFGTPLSN